MKPARQLVLGPAQREAIQAAKARLDEARSGDGVAPDGGVRLRMTPRTGLELVVMTALPCAALLAAKPWLMDFWHGVILWWSERLAMPLGLVRTGDTESLEWRASYVAALVPSPADGVIAAALVIGAFASTWWISDRLVPLKYLVRLLCVVQASALLFFMFVPTDFPYSMTGHIASMLNAGFYMMLAIPPLMALGWGVLRIPLQQKLLYPGLILLYFVVMMPHKALLHAVVVQHFSALYMPMLYLCFGAALDLMVFVALYSWLASQAPPLALGDGVPR